MFDKAALRNDFSDAAKNYAAQATLQLRIGHKLIASAAPHVPKDALLLDVGAGTGDVTHLWPGQKIALDAAFGMCREAAKKKLPSLQAVAEILPIKTASVDVVASNVMLQWLADPKQFFNESFRVLKPQGLLAITTFTQGTLKELARAFALTGEQNRLSDFAVSAVITQKIENAGFEIVSEHTETIREYYDDMLDLCLYLRDIGAGNKRSNRPRGLLTLRKLREVATHYPREEEGIPASWNVHQVIARKKI